MSGWRGLHPVLGGGVESIAQTETESSAEAQIRALGFDPQQLTSHEQEELLEIYARCPDEAIAV